MRASQQRRDRQHDRWIARVAAASGTTIRATVRDLRSPIQAEIAIARLIVSSCERAAARLIAADEIAPDGSDIWSILTRTLHGRLLAERDAAEEADRRARWAETDDLLRRMKAGEDVF